MRLFSYIIASDSGFAPNPYHGLCTFACCKPRIRKAASLGDWVIGLTPKRIGHKLVYAMKVQETPLIAEYWTNTRFACKRPDFRSKQGSLGDNIYEPRANGTFRQHRSRHSAIDPSVPSNCLKRFTTEENVKTKTHDLSGRRVLVASDFVYYGFDNAIQLPLVLRESLAVGRGHKSDFLPDIIKLWRAFVTKLPRGIQTRYMASSKTDQQCFRPSPMVSGTIIGCK